MRHAQIVSDDPTIALVYQCALEDVESIGNVLTLSTSEAEGYEPADIVIICLPETDVDEVLVSWAEGAGHGGRAILLLATRSNGGRYQLPNGCVYSLDPSPYANLELIGIRNEPPEAAVA